MRLCSIASGSSGNCIYVGSDRTHLLVDTGISKKRIEEGLKELEIKGKELDGILITHEHADHIQGLGVFSRKYEIPIYGTPGTIRGIRDYKNLGKMPEGLYHEIQVDKEFKLGDIDVHPLLGHLSKENNYEELAYETVKLEVTLGQNPYKGDDIPIAVAKRDQVSAVIEV